MNKIWKDDQVKEMKTRFHHPSTSSFLFPSSLSVSTLVSSLPVRSFNLQRLQFGVFSVSKAQVLSYRQKSQIFEFMKCHLSGGKVWLRRTYEGELAKLEKAISKLATNDVKILGSYPGYLVRRAGSSKIRS